MLKLRKKCVVKVRFADLNLQGFSLMVRGMRESEDEFGVGVYGANEIRNINNPRCLCL